MWKLEFLTTPLQTTARHLIKLVNWKQFDFVLIASKAGPKRTLNL